MAEMNKVEPIIITDNETGETYTLEFDRDTVRKAEDNGFSLADVQKYPTKAYDLWNYAFYMHHNREFITRKLTKKKTDELLDAIGGALNAPEGLWARLGDLYVQTYSSLGDGKNGRVTVTF